jgi:hypothetical protein
VPHSSSLPRVVVGDGRYPGALAPSTAERPAGGRNSYRATRCGNAAELRKRPHARTRSSSILRQPIYLNKPIQHWHRRPAYSKWSTP